MRPKYFDILLILVLSCIAIFIGFYFEEFTDIAFSMIFTGQLQSSPGTMFNNYECLFGIAPMVQYLQAIFQHNNIWGLLLVLINTYCIYLFLTLFYKTISKNNRQAITLTVTLAISLLLMNDYILIQFTKTSIFCVFLGLYYLLHERGKILRALFLLVCGVLLRGEAFWLIILFTMAVHFIYDRHALWSNLRMKKYLWLGLLVLGICVNIFNKKIYTDDDARYNSFRAYKYSLLDFKPETKEKLNQRDSVKLYALQNAFFGDNDSLLNPATLIYLGIPKHERFSFFASLNVFSKNELKLKAENIYSLYSSWKELYFLWASIVLIAVILTCKRKRKNLKALMGFLFFTIVYLAAITVYIKMESRVLNPILLITLFYIYKFIPDKADKEEKMHALYIPGAFTFVFMFFFLLKMYYMINDRIKFDRQTTSFFRHWKTNYPNKILVPDLPSWQLFATKAINDPSITREISMISVDDGYMSMMKNHLEHMYAITGSNHFKDYLSYIQLRKKDVFFLGTEDRTRLLEKYIQVIYGADLHFHKISTIPVIHAHGPTGLLQFYVYQLE